MIHRITGKDENRYKTVFFDFDGTIADSGQGCVEAVRHMFSCIGMEERDDARLLKFVGPPVKHHLMDAYGFSQQRADEAYPYFSEYYMKKGMQKIDLYDGIADVLAAVKRSGKTLYVATAKTAPVAIQLLEQFGLLPLFENVFGACHERGVSNKTQVLKDAVKQLGAVPPDAVMVGDRYYDIDGAKAIGIDTIGVLYGYGDREELTGADFLADTVSDLTNLLGDRQ